MKKIFIHSEHVCEKRKLDGKRVETYLKRNNYEIVDSPTKADIIFISSCGTTDINTQETFDMIDEFKKYKAEIIVLGCVPKTDKEKFEKKFHGRSVATDELEKIDDLFPENKIKFNEIEDGNLVTLRYDDGKFNERMKKFFLSHGLTKKLYLKASNFYLINKLGEEHLLLGNILKIPIDDVFYVRTSWGCSQNCAYCGIRKATGKFHSKPFETCMDECKKGLGLGYKKIFLPADDTGAYGKDIGETFPELLKELTQFDGDYEISVFALNPVWLVKYIDELEKIVKSGKISGIAIPVQSGNGRILKLMSRYHNPDKIKDAFLRLKKACPDITLVTHMIAGFPSETEEEFEESLEFIVSAKIDMGVVMFMSVKSGTRAESMDPKIPDDEIVRRVKMGQKFLRKQGYKTNYSSGGLLFGGKK